MLVEHKKDVSVDMAIQDLRIRSLQNTHVIKRLLLCGHLLGFKQGNFSFDIWCSDYYGLRLA